MNGMLRLLNVLIAVDLSPQSKRACEWGLRLAQQARCEACVLHVCRTALQGAPSTGIWAPSRLEQQVDAAIRRETFRDLERWVAGAVPLFAIGPSLLVENGDPAEVIVAVAAAQSSDLIVLGHRRRRSVMRWLLGSVAERVVRSATCPVLTVGAAATVHQHSDAA